MNVTNMKRNDGVEFITLNNRLLTKLLINICTIVSASFAIIVSMLIILYVIVIYNSRNRSKNSFHISLLLTCNTCLAIIFSSTIIMLIQLANMSGDRQLVSLRWIISWRCYLRGYLLFVSLHSIFVSYILQAIYRLCRVVFHQYRCLRTVSSFSYYILTQWIISFLVILPILFMGDKSSTSIAYLPEDFYCQVPVTNNRGVIYALFVGYVIPLCFLCIIYLWIINYIRHSTINRRSISTIRIRRQNKRDTIVIKRLCVVFNLLLTLGAPPVIFFIRYLITDHLHWAFYRLSLMTISISYAFICLLSIYMTPQIYRPIRILFGYCSHQW